jgi:hypothetical protein
MPMPQPSLVSALLALQFVAFGWRLNREITVGDKGNKTWLPLPDYLNLSSFVAVVFCCVVIPLVSGSYVRVPSEAVSRVANTTLSVGYVLIAFHPISQAAHYRFFSKEGRSIYLRTPNGDYPWYTGQEIFSVTLSLIFASIAGCFAWHP